MRVALLVVALVLVLAGCAGAPAATTPLRATVAQCAALATLEAQLDCIEPRLQDAVLARDVAALLATLSDAVRNGTLDDCHMIAHHLGHDAFEMTANMTIALQLGSTRCAKGYYHGVIESTLSSGAANASVVGLCDGLRENATAWDGCVHGLGHGLMWRDEADLLHAVADCGAIAASDGRARCEDGAMMENSLRYATLPEPEYRRVAPFVCSDLALTDEQKGNCYDEMGNVAELHYRHKLDDALAFCRVIDWDARAEASCEQGARYEAAHVNDDA